MNSFEQMESVIAQRRAQPQAGSYTCYLFSQGLDKILKKCGEECAETIIAAKNGILLDTENEMQIQKLQQALTQLKPDEQALVTLFYEEEKNIEEIAYIFHLTESNVKVKLHRIRKKLCNLMKEEI